MLPISSFAPHQTRFLTTILFTEMQMVYKRFVFHELKFVIPNDSILFQFVQEAFFITIKSFFLSCFLLFHILHGDSLQGRHMIMEPW